MDFVVTAQAVGANVDPTLFWMAAMAGMGSGFMWLLREHLKSKSEEIQYLREENAGWKRLAIKGADITEKAVEGRS